MRASRNVSEKTALNFELTDTNASTLQRFGIEKFVFHYSTTNFWTLEYSLREKKDIIDFLKILPLKNKVKEDGKICYCVCINTIH